MWANYHNSVAKAIETVIKLIRKTIYERFALLLNIAKLLALGIRPDQGNSKFLSSGCFDRMTRFGRSHHFG